MTYQVANPHAALMPLNSMNAFDGMQNTHQDEWELVDFLLNDGNAEEDNHQLSMPAFEQKIHMDQIPLPLDPALQQYRPMLQHPASLPTQASDSIFFHTNILTQAAAAVAAASTPYNGVQSAASIAQELRALHTPITSNNFTSVISPSGALRLSTKEKMCSFPDCGKLARSRGLCMRHGGGRRCEVDGCMKGSQSGGRCISHGGGKRCKIDNCLNAQQSEGLCIAHGGGKRCTVDGCNKSSQRRGFCHVHGGGQKCTMSGCMKGAQRGGLCVEHGGRRYCKEDGCQKTARGGGYCISHGGDTRCKEADCNKIAKDLGLCTFHLTGRMSTASMSFSTSSFRMSSTDSVLSSGSSPESPRSSL